MTTIHPSIKLNLLYMRRYITLTIVLLSSTLSYAQTNTITWTGIISQDWHDEGNWSTMNMPSALDSVIIPGFLSAENPIIMSGKTAEANSVNILFGGFLSVGMQGRLYEYTRTTIIGRSINKAKCFRIS